MPYSRLVLFVFMLLALPVQASDAQPMPIGERLSWLWQRFMPFFGNEAAVGYQPSFRAADATFAKEYVVGIHPLHNPKRLFDIYAPIVDVLNHDIPGVRFKLEASRNYEQFEQKLYRGHFDFAMPNPLQTLESLNHGYRVFGKMADDEDFRGLILVRKDSAIREVGDLKGKSIAYPAKTALAATLMPQYYLYSHGLNVNIDVENRYVGSQESAIMSVLLGHTVAAATWPVPWKTFCLEHPEQAADLEVKWQTEALKNNAWVVRRDIPETLVVQFAGVLFSLQHSEAGRKMLAAVPVSRFEAADDLSYAPVRAFLNRFTQTVGPIE